MNYYNVLENGKEITINPKERYFPATFWIEEGKLWVYNSALRICNSDLTEKTFNKHIQKLIAEGFTITVQDRTKTIKGRIKNV